MQRSTKRVRIAVVKLNVVSGVHARPDADRGADDERHSLGFGFSHGLGRRSVVTTLVKEFVGLCSEAHKPTYVLRLTGCLGRFVMLQPRFGLDPVLATVRAALLPDNDSFPRSLRLALEQLDAEIQKLHEEAAIAA